ncbi:MAG TPA: hypothetical protein VJ997_15315, partial [Longimicrobiales bacterium]|nr:hypothetical protein [Longimicrobiales bacterium]
MRFAYIDSQGNEVTIPSVDALALRIELGAIGPDTDLYDAQADRWGPAQSHEIFHTLSRDVGGDGGFVAPPPPIATPVEPEAAEEAEPESEPEQSETLPELDAGPGVADAEDSETLVAVDDGGLGFDLTLTDAPGSRADEEDEDESGAFDFGGFGPLELEGGPADEGASPPPSKADPGPPEDAPDFLGEGFDLGMELEQPMADFTADQTWMEPEGLPDDDEAMDFRPGSAQTE